MSCLVLCSSSLTVVCNSFSSSLLFNSTSLQLLNTLLESFSSLPHSCSFFLISSDSLLRIRDTRNPPTIPSPSPAPTAIGPTGSSARAPTVLAAAPVPVPTPTPSTPPAATVNFALPYKASDLFLSSSMHCVIRE